MKTYEELLEVGESDVERGKFCEMAVNQFMSTQSYKDAVEAERYYNKHNTTIENFQKWLYTVSGRRVEDVYSANYKLKTSFFRREVTQVTQYLLGNGVTFDEDGIKERLGNTFDFKVQQALKLAMVGSRSFGYWNNDHLEVFGYACTDKHAGFCPLYSEDTADMMAGIRFRFKKVGSTTLAFYTLYDINGVTEYRRGKDGTVTLIDKHPYKLMVTRTKAEGVVDTQAEDYNGKLPIVPLYANDAYESELIGVWESIDAYDLLKSGLCNSLDDAAEVYWLVRNAGGMDDTDLAQFIQRLRTTHAAVVDASIGGDVTANTVTVPVDSRMKTLEMLRADIYEDMMIVDMKSLSAAQKTTQEIRSAYQAQDNKCDDIEYFLVEFVRNICDLAGIPNATPTFNRSKVVNEAEQTQMVLSAANYVAPETIIRHLPWLSSDEQEAEIKRYEDEQINRYYQDGENEEGDEE